MTKFFSLIIVAQVALLVGLIFVIVHPFSLGVPAQAASPGVSLATLAATFQKEEAKGIALIPDTVPTGKQTYQMVQGQSVLPRIVQATIDPPAVNVGDVQKLQVVVQDPQPIVSVLAQIQTDNGTTTVPLTLQGPTTAAQLEPQRYAVDTDNNVVAVTPQNKSYFASLAEADEGPNLTYVGQWTVHDTHNTHYATTFIARDSAGNVNSITLAWSDACSIPLGGSWSLSSNGGNCTISAADGVDNGNATISTGYTLTLNATFAYNSGFSISIPSGGSIAIGSGGELLKSPIWMVDADGDGYASGTIEYDQASAPTHGVRRYLLTGTGDCNDASSSVYRIVYQDHDGDSYGNAASSSCVGVTTPGGYVSNNTDCYDSNASANPVDVTYFDVNRGDGSYDYNCDLIQSAEYTFSSNANVCSGFSSSGACNGSNTFYFPGTAPSCGQEAASAEPCAWGGTACGPTGQQVQYQYCR